MASFYNFESEWAALEVQGYEFKTRCDIEVVLLLYRHYRQDCLNRLRGIWDSFEETLFLARDPFGIKPLFYTQHNGRLIFAAKLRVCCADDLAVEPMDTSVR